MKHRWGTGGECRVPTSHPRHARDAPPHQRRPDWVPPTAAHGAPATWHHPTATTCNRPRPRRPAGGNVGLSAHTRPPRRTRRFAQPPPHAKKGWMRTRASGAPTTATTTARLPWPSARPPVRRRRQRCGASPVRVGAGVGATPSPSHRCRPLGGHGRKAAPSKHARQSPLTHARAHTPDKRRGGGWGGGRGGVSRAGHGPLRGRTWQAAKRRTPTPRSRGRGRCPRAAGPPSTLRQCASTRRRGGPPRGRRPKTQRTTHQTAHSGPPRGGRCAFGATRPKKGADPVSCGWERQQRPGVRNSA